MKQGAHHEDEQRVSARPGDSSWFRLPHVIPFLFRKRERVIYIFIYISIYMGGCQNHGPFLGTLNIRCRIIIGTQKRTIILTTTHIHLYIYIYIHIYIYICHIPET